jgi:4-amino-4-deoxy-L-arabinose transferase-like glycosyltransferase
MQLQVTTTRPIAFGDEGFHVANARYIGENVEYPLTTPLFGSEIQPERFNRPPLWNLIEGSFYMMFGFSETIPQILHPLLALLTGIAVFTLTKRLYDENVAMIAAIIAVTIPSYVTYVVAFYTAIPYMFFFSIAFLCILNAIKNGGKKYWMLGGIFSGLAILTNIAGLFLVFFMIAFGLFRISRNFTAAGVKDSLKKYGGLIVVTMLIISPWIGRNVVEYYVPGCTNPQSIITGACTGEPYYQPVHEFEARTQTGGSETGIVSFGLSNYVRFAYGFSDQNPLVNFIGLAFIPFVFIAGVVLMLKRRDSVDKAMIISLVILLLIFMQFGGLFSGRSEDTARYFLTAAPIIGIAAAGYVASIGKNVRKGHVITIAAIIIVASLSITAAGQKIQTMSIVKTFSPMFFDACDWVKGNTPEDASMLSLHTYPTRYNCERAAVWEIPDKADIVLSNDLDLVRSRLEANGIGYVFIQKFSLSNEALGQSYPLSFVQFLEQNSETFVKVYENGPSLQQCVSQGGCDGSIIYRLA